MARKVSVEHSPEHLKRSVAARLVRRGWAIWLIPNLKIRRLAVRAKCSEPRYERGAPYIPERMPPLEIPNTKFVPPLRRIPPRLPSELAQA